MWTVHRRVLPGRAGPGLLPPVDRACRTWRGPAGEPVGASFVGRRRWEGQATVRTVFTTIVWAYLSWRPCFVGLAHVV